MAIGSISMEFWSLVIFCGLLLLCLGINICVCGVGGGGGLRLERANSSGNLSVHRTSVIKETTCLHSES